MASELLALPPGVVIDPFWDWNPGFALPLWLMIMVILVIFIAGSNLWWIYKFLVMRPVQGHGEASRAGNEKTQQVLMFGMNRAFSIQALEYIEKVLSFKDPQRIARWLQTSPYAVGMLGYKSIMLVMEIFDIPKDPIAEMAIGVACRKHNADVSMDNAIVDYNGYRENRERLEHENPNGVEIDIYREYDPGEIHQYTPEKRTSGIFGRACLKSANDLNMSTPQSSWLEKNLPVMLCIVFAVIVLALIYMFTTNGAATPQLPSGLVPPTGGVK